MAIPKVFVSSTCYDLEEERAQLVRFIQSYGFHPILSDYSDVFYSPDEHTHESCVQEVAHCDLFILIISGRFGGEYIKGEGESITQAEYNKARDLKIPIFCFVKSDVLNAQLYYKENTKTLSKEFAEKIIYPSVHKQSDAVPIFSFIHAVQRSKGNNAIEAYNSFSDIENHLRKQWAGLFYNLLDKRKNNSTVEHISTILEKMSGSSAKLESLVESIHKNNQGEEETEKLINIAKIRQSTQEFFFRLEKFISNFQVSFSESDRARHLNNIDKTIKINPSKFDNYIEYINSITPFEVSLDPDGVVFFEYQDAKFGFHLDEYLDKKLTESFNVGVKRSDLETRSEYLESFIVSIYF